MSINNGFNAKSTRPAPDIKTRGELDKLKAERAREKPQARMQLTPNGHIRTQVHTLEAAKRNARVGQLKAALEQARQEAGRQFSVKSISGKAKADFGQGR